MMADAAHNPVAIMLTYWGLIGALLSFAAAWGATYYKVKRNTEDIKDFRAGCKGDRALCSIGIINRISLLEKKMEARGEKSDERWNKISIYMQQSTDHIVQLRSDRENRREREDNA